MANDVLPDESRRLDSSTLVDSRIVVEAESSQDVSKQRIRLIEKKYDVGLTPDEETELDRLQRLSSEALDRDFPAPRLSSGDLEVLRQALNSGCHACGT